MKFGQALAWADLETTGIDKQHCYVLEVAVILTDLDLNPIDGYTEVVAMSRPALEHLRQPDNVPALDMHKNSGLIRESIDSNFDLAQVETAVVNMMRQSTTFDPGEFILAGSGVAQFDYQVIQRTMPTFASWLTYYQLDVGNVRRAMKILSGGATLVNPHTPSYMDGVKKHRALPDVQAHLEEGRRYQEFFRRLASST